MFSLSPLNSRVGWKSKVTFHLKVLWRPSDVFLQSYHIALTSFVWGVSLTAFIHLLKGKTLKLTVEVLKFGTGPRCLLLLHTCLVRENDSSLVCCNIFFWNPGHSCLHYSMTQTLKGNTITVHSRGNSSADMCFIYGRFMLWSPKKTQTYKEYAVEYLYCCK